MVCEPGIRDSKIGAEAYGSWGEVIEAVLVMVPLSFGVLKFAVFVLKAKTCRSFNALF